MRRPRGGTASFVLVVTLAIGLTQVAVLPAAAATTPSRPFGSHPVAYPAGSARAPGTVKAVDDATAAKYDAWKAAYLATGCTTDQYYVNASTSVAPGTMVVSEGQGYGMVISALMAGHDPNAQTAFDGLYRYVLDHPSAGDPGLMAWHQDAACASIPGDNSSATDGDLDIAFGLLLADTQWGSTGTIDYRTAALARIAAIKRSEINPQTLLPKLGDWVSPGSPYWFGTRTSDAMLDHFVAFENATGDAFWGQVARASSRMIAALQSGSAPTTGLLPDFAIDTDTVPVPAPANYLESADDGDYNWNAVRTPWRLASSHLLTGDTSSASAAQRMSRWIVDSTAGSPSAVRAGYHLDGTPLQSYGNPAFTALFGAGAMTSASNQAWVASTWAAMVAAPPSGYFTDSLVLQGMLLVSGNSWLPRYSAAPALQRIGGADRYAVSAAVSASTFAAGTPTVYLASGEVFPDALSASAAAGADGSPVLLVQKGGVPAAVQSELDRLHPRSIVLLGGLNTISAAVESSLRTPGVTVERIDGADRYVVSAKTSARSFDPGVPVAYVASGEVFPDALSGSAAAGVQGSPVLLTRRDAVPEAIAAELRRLDPAAVVVLGGANTVSPSTFSALNAIAPATRVGGVDRYDVAAAVSARTFVPARTPTVYIASGEVFPDALSASATAIADRAPVLLVTRDGVPAATASELTRLAPARIVVLGGANTVSEAVVNALRGYLAAR